MSGRGRADRARHTIYTHETYKSCVLDDKLLDEAVRLLSSGAPSRPYDAFRRGLLVCCVRAPARSDSDAR